MAPQLVEEVSALHAVLSDSDLRSCSGYERWDATQLARLTHILLARSPESYDKRWCLPSSHIWTQAAGRRSESACSTLMSGVLSCLGVLLDSISGKLLLNKVGKYSRTAAITAEDITHQWVTDEDDAVVCHSVYACVRRTEL